MIPSFNTRLQKREILANLRQLPKTKALIDFASNDYLGLARSQKFVDSVLLDWALHSSHLIGLGSTGSRLLTGNSAYAEDLENKIAKFHGFEAGVLFNSGYMANLGLLSAIAQSEDTVLFDAKIHPSTRDGIRLSRAKALAFRHNDPNHLELRLKSCSARGKRFICVESIYSTDGSQAPLIKICQLAEKYNAHLIVDEAHAIGIFGPNGQGLVSEHNLTPKVFAQVVTFGKAIGAQGAAVLGNSLLKQVLINFSNAYIYTTALPFYALASIHKSYDLFPQMETERQHLKNLIQIFQKTFSQTSATPIQTVQIKGNVAVKSAALTLARGGFDVRPLLSPTVQRGHEVLRLCLHAFNTEQQLINLCQKISSLPVQEPVSARQ